MSETARPNPDFQRLLDALIDGSLTSAERDELAAILQSDQAARRRYCEYLSLHTLLQAEHVRPLELPSDIGVQGSGVRNQESEVANQSTPLGYPLGGPVLGRMTAALNRPVYWSVLAAGVLFAAYFVGVSWNMLGRSSRHAGHPLGHAVAVISDTHDVEWSLDTDPRLTATSSRRIADVRQGEPLQITSGLVEIKLNQGATLIVQGPAEWSIDGENNATLKRGKLVAKVPQQAIGFTLETPTATIIDLGTEFGVEVKKDGAADVHVSKGKVDVQSAGGSGKSGPGKVSAGQSVQITAEGARVVDNPTVPDKFKRLVDAGNKKEQIAAKPLERWREASQKLRTDPSLVAYYDFESQGAQLRNVLADKLHGEIITEREKVPWTQGRWYGKQSLAFGKDFATVSIPVDPALQPKGDWSVAVWFRLDALPPANAFSLIVGKGNQPARSYSLFLRANGAVDWSTNSTDGRPQYHYSRETCKVGSWNQAVGVIESNAMHLYLNGVEAADALPIKGSVAFDETPLMLGRSREPVAVYLPFTGVIDELSIYSRALRAQEIEEMYRTGKPER